MNVLRARIALVPSLLAALAALSLAAPARASVADPPSGTMVNLLIGEHFKIKLKNVAGCTFDYTAFAANPSTVEVTPGNGAGVKSAVVELVGLKPGATTLTINSDGGSCTPSQATYTVVVTADNSPIVAAVNAVAKAELKEFKLELKKRMADYKAATSELAAQVKAGTLDDDTLQVAFHDQAEALREAIFLAATEAYTNVIAAGTELLFQNGVQVMAPKDLFAGGGGVFDNFQNGVCALIAKFRADFDKLADKAGDKFVKAGAMRLGQWGGLPSLFAAGPWYPTQIGVYTAPAPQPQPLTWTLRPTVPTLANGRLLVSGRADATSTSVFHVTLTRLAEDAEPVVFDLTPAITPDNEWSAEFPGLLEGSWMLATHYENDAYVCEVPIAVFAWAP